MLHSLEIKMLGLDVGANWHPATAKKVFDDYVSRLAFSTNRSISHQRILKIPPYLQRSYALWKAGIDLKGVLKRQTFYRQRNKPRTHGTNIAVQPQQKSIT